MHDYTKNEVALKPSKQGEMPKKIRSDAMSIKRKAVSVAVAMCFASQYVSANPTGATVVRGGATISNSGSTMSIANTPGAIIHWDNFSINAGETTVFNQVNAASAVLNRVTGGNISQILGTLRSNGQVYLINPSGIVFGANAVVDVAGLVASTLNIKDADFIAGKKLFNADTANTGSVINHGQITTPSGGFVYLLAPQVENNGIITTPSGEAILAAGNTVELVDSTDPRQRVSVSAENENVNLSQMMVQSNGNIFSVLNRGTVSANTVQQDATGRIFFKSAGSVQTTTSSIIETKGSATLDGGTFIGFADTVGQYAGSIDARGKSGGFIETSGKYLNVAELSYLSAKALSVDGEAGTWLLDPLNITISSAATTNATSSGSTTLTYTGTATGSTISTSDIETALNGGTNVIVDTANASFSQEGSITITSSISVDPSSDVTFTLNADGNITMSSGTSITDTSGSGALTVEMYADRDANGGGGLTLTQINVEGDIILDSNSGGLTLDASTSANPAFLRAEGDIEIDVAGDVSLLAGDGNQGNVSARIVSVGSTTIKLGGNLSLTAGDNGGAGDNTSAFIQSGGSLDIFFTDITPQLSLTAGSGGSSATVMQNAYISADGSLTIKGTNAAGTVDVLDNNPLITLTSQTVSGSGSADAFIKASGNININAQGMFIDSGAGGNARIFTDHSIGTRAINIIVQDSDGFGLLSMETSATNVASSKIGSDTGDVNIDIQAGRVSLLSSANGVVAIGSSSPTPTTANVRIRAYNSGILLSESSGGTVQVGNESFGGSGTVRIEGYSSDTNDSTGVLISGATIGNNAGGDIIIIGQGASTGGVGVLISDTLVSGRTDISTDTGNISISGTGFGSSEGIATESNALNPMRIRSNTGNITMQASSEGTNSISLLDGQVEATSGTVTLSATNNSINLDNVTISAGTAVNLNAASGEVVQSSSSTISTPQLNINALNINLFGLLNSFNSALFNTSLITSLNNIATGTGNYVFLQNATLMLLGESNEFDVFNITASQGLTLDGTGTSMSLGALDGLVNLRTSNLLLTNGAIIDADTINIEAGDITLNLGSEIVSNTLSVDASTFNMNNASVTSESGSMSFTVANAMTLSNGSTIDSGVALNIKANALTMSSSDTTSVGDTNIITNNLQMSDSTIFGENVNVNSAALAFKLAADGSNLAQIQNIFNRLTKGVQISLQGSTIFAANNANVAGAEVKLVGSEIGSGNITSVFSRNNIELTGGTDEARIFAQNEVLLVAGEQVILNDGASAAIVETDSPNTIFLSFPQLSSDGYVVNGVVNAITNGRSGFFTGGVSNRTPAVLDTNLFVAYNNSSGLLASLLNRNFNDTDLLASTDEGSDLEDDDDGSNANSAKECS